MIYILNCYYVLGLILHSVKSNVLFGAWCIGWASSWLEEAWNVLWLGFSLSWECLKGPWTNAMGIVSPCHGCGMLVSLQGPSNHIEANQPFSLAIRPNEICRMLELVVTRYKSHPHFECSLQPLWLSNHPLHPVNPTYDINCKHTSGQTNSICGPCHFIPTHSKPMD